METEGFIWKTKGPIFPIFLVPTGMLSVNIAKHPVDVNEKKKTEHSCHHWKNVTDYFL